MITDYFCCQLRQSVKVLFPLESTEEVISLTYEEICPVPGVSAALIGVVNQRGKLLWVLELSDLLQIEPDKKSRRSLDNLTLLVLSNSRNSDQQLGCVISHLEGIIPVDLQVQSLIYDSHLAGKELNTSSIVLDNEKHTLIDVQAILKNIFNLELSNL